MSDRIDIGEALGRRATITIEPEESIEEQAARIRKERAEARYELVKAYLLLSLLAVVIVVVAGLTVYTGFVDANASADTKRWSQTVLSALLTGLVSFVVGQKLGRK